MSGTTDTTTPLMQQYREIKSHHQDAILLFRMGDFYEMFYEDAQVASRVLGLTLTSRNNGGAAEVPLAGVPVKAVTEYLRRLVQAGFRVSICEQMEDPKLAKGIVKRAVIETITPGAAMSDDLLDGSRNNWLCAVHAIPGATTFGVAAADLSTGEFRLAVVPPGALDVTIGRFAPRELLWPAAVRGLPYRFRRCRRRRSSRSATVGNSILPSRPTTSPGSSPCGDSRGSDWNDRTTRRSAQQARYCATSAPCSRAACPTWCARWSSAQARRCRWMK